MKPALWDLYILIKLYDLHNVSLFHPCKRQISVLHFIAFNVCKVLHKEYYVENILPIQIHMLVLSLYIIWHAFLFVFQIL